MKKNPKKSTEPSKLSIERNGRENKQTVVGSDGKLKKVRKDWEFNHDLILKAYEEILTKTGRFPTQTQVAEACNLSRNAIAKHIRRLKLADLAPRHKLRGDRVLHGLAKGAEKGDARAGKLFFQLVYGWNEKIEVEHEVGEKVVRVGIVPRPVQKGAEQNDAE